MATEYARTSWHSGRSGTGSRRLSDIASIRAGYQFRGKVEPDPDGNVAVVQIKDIEDRRRLNTSSLARVAFDRPVEQYIVGRGDVLFLSRGHRQFATAIDADLRDTIAAGYFYILRTNNGSVRPDFLAWYLNQQPMQDKFKQVAKGSHMPFVSMAEFQELQIPVPSLDVQARIVALAELAEREQGLLAELASRRAELVQCLSLGAANHAPSRAAQRRPSKRTHTP